jgi:hypothetical protein
VSAASTVQQGVQGDPKRVCSQLVGKSNCDARSYASPQLPSSVLFVVDRSGSMSCNPPPTQTVESCNANPQRADPSKPSKWEITIGALDDAFAGLKGSAAAVGLSMFSTDGFCGVDSTPIVGLDAISTTHLGALSDAMHENQPAGGTPIVGSLISAYHHLHEELHAAGNRYVVLITDGEESCGTPPRAIACSRPKSRRPATPTSEPSSSARPAARMRAASCQSWRSAAAPRATRVARMATLPQPAATATTTSPRSKTSPRCCAPRWDRSAAKPAAASFRLRAAAA